MGQLLRVVAVALYPRHAARVLVRERVQLLVRHALHALDRPTGAVARDLLAAAQQLHPQVGVVVVEQVPLREQNLNEVHVLLAERLEVLADVLHVAVLSVAHHVGAAHRLTVQHDILEAGQHQQLAVDVAALVRKAVVLRALQADGEPVAARVFLRFRQVLREPRRRAVLHALSSSRSRSGRRGLRRPESPSGCRTPCSARTTLAAPSGPSRRAPRRLRIRIALFYW